MIHFFSLKNSWGVFLSVEKHLEPVNQDNAMPHELQWLVLIGKVIPKRYGSCVTQANPNLRISWIDGPLTCFFLKFQPFDSKSSILIVKHVFWRSNQSFGLLCFTENCPLLGVWGRYWFADGDSVLIPSNSRWKNRRSIWRYWRIVNMFSKFLENLCPVGSMGLVILPTWKVDSYGKCSR